MLEHTTPPTNITHRTAPAVARTDIVTRQLAATFGNSTESALPSSGTNSTLYGNHDNHAGGSSAPPELGQARLEDYLALTYARWPVPPANSSDANLDKFDIMCRYLYNLCMQHNWLELLSERVPCVALKVNHSADQNSAISSLYSHSAVLADNYSQPLQSCNSMYHGFDRQDVLEYRVFPPTNNDLDGAYFAEYVAGLNVKVCVRLEYTVVSAILSCIPPDATAVPLSENARIQVLDTLADLPRARKYQYAAFVREDESLLVWADSVTQLDSLATALESRMMELIWKPGSLKEMFQPPTAVFDEVSDRVGIRTATEQPPTDDAGRALSNAHEKTDDLEAGAVKIRLTSNLQATAVGIVSFILNSSFSRLIIHV